jgi:hypothetical protein
MSRHRAPRASSVATGLERYCPWSVAQGAAAMSLWPANADRHVATRTLIRAAAALGETSGPTIDAEGWRRWLASRSSKKLRHTRRDGVHDEPLVGDAVLRGKRYLLLAGALESPALQYRILVDALCEALAAGDDPAFRRALGLLESVARLADRVVRLSGIAGHHWPDHVVERQIGVPDDEEYVRLCRALIFTPDAIGQEGESCSDCLAALLLEDGEPAWQPLRRSKDGQIWLVADPWELTRAGLVHAFALLGSSSRRAEIHARLSAEALAIATDAARDMDWEIEHVDDFYVVASADVDCRVVIGVAVLPPQGWELGPPEVEAPGPILDRCAQIAERARSWGAEYSLAAVLGDGRCMTVSRGSPWMNAQEAGHPWMLGLTDLRLIGDALRRDPLALPSALKWIPRPPWPDSLDLVDFIGVGRREEEIPPDREHIPNDGTEHMHLRARLMAGRHSAPHPDGESWAEVYRWSGSPDPRCFTLVHAKALSLLVRLPGRSIWLTCADPAAGPHDLEGVICRMLTFWLARMVERGFPELREPLDRAEVAMRFEIELTELPGPALMTRRSDQHATLIVGPGFVHAMCCGDNSADRMLIAALLDAAGERSPQRQQELVDETAPAGPGTAVIWPYPSLSSNPPGLEPPHLVAPRDRQAVGRAVAGSRVEKDKIFVLAGQDATTPARDLLAVLERGLADRVARLRSESLVALIELHEAAVHQSNNEAILLPARAAFPQGDDYLGEREAVGERDMAIRALIERAAARPPNGQVMLGIRQSGLLRAAAELQIRLGGAFEALRSGEAGGNLIVGPGIGVEVFLEGPLWEATARVAEQLEQAAPDSMQHEHQDWWSSAPREPVRLAVNEPIELEGSWRSLDEAFCQEHGVSFEELLRLFRALSQIAEDQPKQVSISAVEHLAARLVEITLIRHARVHTALSLLTLGPCGYDGTAPGHRPWRPNRERSYLRKPLVNLGDGRVAWSSQHALKASRYLYELIIAARLRCDGPLSKAVTRVSQELDREFEEVLLERVMRLDWEARLRVKAMGGVRMERPGRQQIGDIDVLAWSPELRQVWLLDAKRLAPGLAVDSMIREAKRFEAHVSHHSERNQWVLAHRDQLSTLIGQDCLEWQIQSAIIVNKPLVGAHLAGFDMPVWTFWELADRLSEISKSLSMDRYSPG